MSARSGSSEVATALPPVHFSVQYVLHHRAYSRTMGPAQRAASVAAAVAVSSPPYYPSVPALGWAGPSPYTYLRTAEERARRAGDRELQLHDETHQAHHHHYYEVPAERTWATDPVAVPTASVAAEGEVFVDPLSTLDKRELSKVVLRDALYAQLIDVVPARQYIQCAVWTLNANRLQFDGAVAVLAIHPRDRLPFAPPAPENHWTSPLHHIRTESIVGRLHELLLREDTPFLEGVLRPYLEEGSAGYVDSMTIDGVKYR